MASSAPASAASGLTLARVVEASGHTLDAGIDDFIRVAAAAQHHRHDVLHVSDTELVTRTTALWALLKVDADIRAALEPSGLTLDGVADELTLLRVTDLPETPSNNMLIHEDFGRALRTYLTDLRAPRVIGRTEVAAAIIRAASEDTDGLLFGRMRKLEVDLDSARSALDRLRESTAGGDELNLTDFSASVREVRRELGGDRPVTAARIAGGLQARHPEYAGGTFTRARLQDEEGRTATTDDWLRAVKPLYAMRKVADSRHQVIDGELVLLALAEVDPDLRRQLVLGGVLDELTRSAEVLPQRPILELTAWSTDAPADIDLLGRERLAEALAARLILIAFDEQTRKDSFLVHIDGPWGSGKSTLLGFLDRRLRERFLIVRVNAWLEQRVGVQWWTLLSALRDAVVSAKPWYLRPVVRLTTVVDRVRAWWLTLFAALFIGSAVLLWLVSANHIDLEQSADAADSVLTIIALVSAVAGALIGAGRYLFPGAQRPAEGFMENADNPMQELGKHFARTLRKAGKPVLFVIDDLDRCDETYVVEFLEVIQTLVRDAPRLHGSRRRTARPGPYAFVAADGRWIRSSYEKHYATFLGTGAPGKPLGYQFVEKVFQLHIRMPSMTATLRGAYLASLTEQAAAGGQNQASQESVVQTAKDAVRDARNESELVEAASQARAILDPAARMDVLGDAAVRFSERPIEQAVESWLSPFATYLEPNPRSMKLFVFAYGMSRSLRILEELFVTKEALALWTVVESRWPYLADYLRQNPGAVDGSDPVPADVRDLLAAREVHEVINNTRYGPLTGHLIRQCSGWVD